MQPVELIPGKSLRFDALIYGNLISDVLDLFVASDGEVVGERTCDC